MIVTVSSALILTQTFGSNAPAASAVPLSRKPGRYPPTSSAPPVALTFKKMRLLRVFVICASYSCRAMDGAADALIRSASANVSRHGSINLRVGWFRFPGEQRRGRHQLARLAIAALRYLLGDPCCLQRMTRRRRQTFDGGYLLCSDAR